MDEVVRILHTLADRLDAMGAYDATGESIYDINGNDIGDWVVVDD